MSKQQHATADRETDEDELDEARVARPTKAKSRTEEGSADDRRYALVVSNWSLYKRNQGRITRQVTFGCVAAWRWQSAAGD